MPGRRRYLPAGAATLAMIAALLGAGGTATAEPAMAGPGPCGYTETPDDPPARPVPLPPDSREPRDTGFALVTLRTNLGRVPLVLDRAKAPCTVKSFLHLVRHGFYDRTVCHRLTAYDTLKVLQCGDPGGTGEGGPGYRYPDELPTDLPPWPGDETGQAKLYARATLAMANAGPDTNGSQFFLVYGDSALRPNYTVFGRTTWSGLSTLDRVAAKGVVPTPDDPDPVDGRPAAEPKIRCAVRWF